MQGAANVWVGQLGALLIVTGVWLKVRVGRRRAAPDLGCTVKFAPPTVIEIVKELNSHAGRVASMLGFVLAATSISLGNGPIHDDLVKPDTSHTLIYFSLVLIALVFIGGVAAVGSALQPPLPTDMQMSDQHEWDRLKQHKRAQSRIASLSVFLGVIGLIAVWTSAFTETGAGGQILPVVAGVTLFVVSLGTIRMVWWSACPWTI